MQFAATVDHTGKNTTGIRVPEAIVQELGKGKRPPVVVTFNGYTYRTTVASMNGEYMLSVSAEVRDNANVSAGDSVNVQIELDTAPREVEVPDDLAALLADEPEARQFFDELSYSNKRRIVLSIDGAKTAETRQRRLSKALQDLKNRKV
jgi:hypothetical protein